jgi:aminoglycoside phosphotransferase (APT) family kinase protein
VTEQDQDPALLAALIRLGVVPAGTNPRITALEGGVSSDIRLVELDGARVCVKRALPRLKVAQLWEAPIERNGHEWGWFEVAGAICPGCVPRLIARDAEAGLFVMAYLDPARYPLWKSRLRDGIADPATAASVGERLARIHNATADRADIAARFATDAGFHAIRLEPYLLAAARAHPDRAAALGELVETTSATRRVLVHGDVSPKNILVGPDGPIFLDAECAWFGDPAFDLAFCLNHLLLKCVWNRAAANGFLACFASLAERYLQLAAWEKPARLERRAARLLPGLLLARIDGKSPVEYITAEADKNRVRRLARRLLGEPVTQLAEVSRAWQNEFAPEDPTA